MQTASREITDGPLDAAPWRLGRYVVLATLARGGMATVHVGSLVGAAGFGRLMAIKCCHDALRLDAEMRAMFLDEARIGALVRHPNVVATVDAGETDGRLYLVMEYVEGDSLGRLAGRSVARAMPVPVALRVMIDALAGLHAVHEQRDIDARPLHLVHHDVSPQNILVGADGVTRVADFGIATGGASAGRVLERRVKGKLAYMAPEQLRAMPVCRRSDVFSAGVVLWEALTGRALFRRNHDGATVYAVLRGEVPPPSRVAGAHVVPPALDAVVLRALAREPGERFATADDFAAALAALPVRCANTREVAEHVRVTLGGLLVEHRRVLAEQAARAGCHGVFPAADASGQRAILQQRSAALPREFAATTTGPRAVTADDGFDVDTEVDALRDDSDEPTRVRTPAASRPSPTPSPARVVLVPAPAARGPRRLRRARAAVVLLAALLAGAAALLAWRSASAAHARSSPPARADSVR